MTKLALPEMPDKPFAWAMKWALHSPSFTTNKTDYVSWANGRAEYPSELTPLFTADQLHARDRQIVELCAQIADNAHPQDWAFIGSAIRSLIQGASNA